MTEISLLNSNFEAQSKIKIELDLSPEAINEPVVYQVLNAIRTNRRQGTASTKTRAFVSGGGKKPFKQKGTGRARQGTNRSPLMVGGAVVHGPQPRKYNNKVNKKVMNIALESMIADRFQSGKLFVVDTFKFTGKTKELFKFLEERKMTSSLLVTEMKDSKTLLAARNLKTSLAVSVDSLSIYDVLRYDHLLIEKSAFDAIVTKVRQ